VKHTQNKLIYAAVAVVILGFIAWGWFVRWYHAHPAAGRFVVLVMVLWGVWLCSRFVRVLPSKLASIFKDPYTRIDRGDDN